MNIYDFDFTPTAPLLKNHLKMGGDNGVEKFEITNRYILRNGKPWIPIMGEYHYSRASESEWKTELSKMKAGGINVVASYIIWIHHEEIEGEISFEGNLNLRKFVETAYECGLHVCLRIGPWIHGEVKNGGFPDWLQHKENLKLRTNDSEYLKYCRRWYQALADHLKGLMFSDGKPLFAIQIENELINNKEHIETLLALAKEVGFNAPIYTATGWGSKGDAQIPRDSLIPLYGGYPEAPWDCRTVQLEPSNHYFFSYIRNDSNIGSDLIASTAGDTEKGGLDYTLYPFATCELGGGNQITYHRRPIINSNDISAITNVKMGSGVNLLGYYMYHGGRNPIGKTTTMNESKKSGYENDLPIIDYDFQAQLGAWGAVREHYRTTRRQALFLEDFGHEFALTVPYFQKKRIESIYDFESLRYSARLKDNSGYLFINNYSRKEDLSEHSDVKFNINGDIIPNGCFNIKNKEFGFIPYNMKLGEINLKYALMQPVCKEKNAYFFFAPFENQTEFCFSKNSVADISANAEICYTDNEIIVNNPNGNITLTDNNGQKVEIIILSKLQAQHLSRQNGKLYLSDAEMVTVDNEVYVYSTDIDTLKCKIYTENGFIDCKTEALKPENTQIAIKEISAFHNKYMEQFDCGNNTERKYYEITLPENRDNIILSMDITGDIAQLYADDTLLADAFLNGRTWYVGPDKALNCDKLRLVVSEVTPENKYFETDKTSGLIINKIEAKRLYKAKVLS